MSLGGEDTIRSLREALKFSPDNLPLRQHLAETLLGYGRLDEAEKELRDAISTAPVSASVGLKMTLARVYLQQDKSSRALVVLEELIKAAAGSPRGAEPRLRVLYARAMLRSGEAERAAHQYRTAVELDPTVADPVLAEQLAVPVTNRSAPADEHQDEADAGDAAGTGRTGKSPVELERPRVNFADVGGMDRIKDEIRLKIIYPLQKPELYKAYGKAIGGGILMYGPPGCGKTHLARATAGEVKARFISVGISDVLNMYIGESERNLHEIFEQARANTPCVLFFDEVDALGASRADLRQSAARQLINQFLSELDGVNSSNEGVLVLAATNAPWHIDSAFRRPGRFDRILFVPPPDDTAREAIWKIALNGKPVEDIDHAHLAKKSDSFSGADIKSVVDIAIEGKLREALAKGEPEPIRTKDLLAAAKAVRPTAREWFSTAKNHALYANQGGLYDSVLEYMKLR